MSRYRQPLEPAEKIGKQKMLRRFEAVTVCVNYADFLAETLPDNLQHFDHMVVVTSHADKATQDLCAHLGVECHPTDVMYGEGTFAKGRAVDFGLAFLRKDEWLIHLDADIWLPPRTRGWLQTATLDPECIYGIDRANCTGYEAWCKFRDRPRRDSVRAQHIRHWLVVPPPFPLGARLALPDHAGYVPIGFFQLWHAKHDRRYPLQHTSAERSDVLHPLQWPKANRRLLPEIIAVHLASEGGPMGANWHGRKTSRFAPRGNDAAPCY